MNDQLETDVRGLLVRASENIPADAIERITNADYRPRTGWLTPRRTAGALGGLGIVGAGIAAAVALTAAAPAFAGWKATPEVGHRTPSAAADASCQSRLSALPTTPAGNWSPVVTDVRGPYTLAVFEDADVDGTCITGPTLNEASVSGANGRATSIGGAGGSLGDVRGSASAGGSGSSGLERYVQTHLDSTNGSYTVIQGQIASDVSGLTVELQDGTDVDTTIGGGWFVAWWPSDEAAVSAQVTTPSGVVSQSINP